MIRIILVRHGRTAWNVGADAASEPSKGHRFRGIIDLPLAAEGIEQARLTGRRLSGIPLVGIYSSPLQRAARTAQIIASPHGISVEVLPGLSSMDYGAWAGRFHHEVAQDWPALYGEWHRDPFAIQIPDGESTAALRDRAVEAVRQILERHAGTPERSDGADIALVSHQVVTKTLVCALAGLPGETYWRVRQDLCNLTRFDYQPDSGAFVLSGLNDTCHLDPALPRAHTGEGVRILLVRHGQTAWNAGAGPERFRGRTDLPLDQVGRHQAGALARRLQDEPIDAVYSSPLQRTRQTVASLAERLGLDVQADGRLLDIDYGLFQGLDRQKAAAAFPQQYASWLATPGQVHFPQGECLGDVQHRLIQLLDELAGKHRGRTVLLAGHQVVNKVLACTLLGLDLDRIWHVGQDTTAINVFQQIDGAWHILRLNDVCHLIDVGAGSAPATESLAG